MPGRFAGQQSRRETLAGGGDRERRLDVVRQEPVAVFPTLDVSDRDGRSQKGQAVPAIGGSERGSDLPDRRADGHVPARDGGQCGTAGNRWDGRFGIFDAARGCRGPVSVGEPKIRLCVSLDPTGERQQFEPETVAKDSRNSGLGGARLQATGIPEDMIMLAIRNRQTIKLAIPISSFVVKTNAI